MSATEPEHPCLKALRKAAPGKLTEKDLRERTGLGRDSVRRWLFWAWATGTVVFEYQPTGRRGAWPRRYSLASKASPVVRTTSMSGGAR